MTIPYFPKDRSYYKGRYLVLYIHHEGQSGWMTRKELIDRIQDIRVYKPDATKRLSRMRVYPDSKKLRAALKAFNEAETSAMKVYNKATAYSWKAFKETFVWSAFDKVALPAEKAFDKAIAYAWKAMNAILYTLPCQSGTEFEASLKETTR